MLTCYIVCMEKDLTTQATLAFIHRNEAFIRFANLHLDPNADMLEYAVAIDDALKAKEAYEAASAEEASYLNKLNAG